MRCRVCHTEVPTAAFCGVCGATLFHLPGDGPERLRVRAHAAAPEEQVARLSLVTTLFPHLSPHSRPAFRTALAATVFGLITLAVGHWQSALIAVSALGVPAMFGFYARRTFSARDVGESRLLLTVLIGGAGGVVWTLLTGPLLTGRHSGPSGVVVPVGGALIMLAPAVLLRVLGPATRESLDGYLIGAAGALAYTAAAVLTRSAPQLAGGLVAHDRSTAVLFVHGVINGVTMPVTAAAAGGMVGAALWFSPRSGRASRGIAAATFTVLVIYVGLALVDRSRPGLSLLLGWHLVVAAIAVLAVRATVHLALLHEAPTGTGGQPVLCSHCRHVVPELAFCPNCGVAQRASSRSARTLLRAAGAIPHDDGQFVGDPRTAALFPGYATPGAAYTAPLLPDTSRTRLLLSMTVALAVAVAVIGTIAVAVTPAPASYACPPDCGRAPIGPPVGDAPGQSSNAGSAPQASGPLVAVHTFPRFTSADGRFSVAYFPSAEVTTTPDGVTLRYSRLFDGEIRLFETPAHHRTPLQIVTDYISDHYPTAKTDYEIPNAMVGYEPGYGEVDDFSPDDPSATYRQGRLLVMAAVRNGLALVATAEGPKMVFTPKNSDHPSAVNLEIATALGNSVNSFTWNEGSPK